MFSLDNQSNDLWQGGSWEQPSPQFPPLPVVSIPARAMRPSRPKLKVRKRRRSWPWYLAGFLLILLGIFVVSVAIGSIIAAWQGLDLTLPDMAQQEYNPNPPTIAKAPTGTGVTVQLHPNTGTALTFSQIYEKNAPSIVSIESECEDGYSTGTGVILTQDGYIVTNAHVVAGAKAVDVYTCTDQKLKASLVGFDPKEDLAVLKVKATGLTPAQFGDSSSLRCGDPVAALGDPLGYRSTITDGIVSALDREIEMEESTMVLIQTSAAINFGNSGGALINQYGQVVGITTIKIVSNDGSAEALGFAIPSQRIKHVVDTLIDGREVRPGVFGFTVYVTTEEGGGLKVQSVNTVSDAWKQGIRAGDILVSANGQPINGIQDLSRIKLALGAGDTVAITYVRDGVSTTVDVALIDADLVPN